VPPHIETQMRHVLDVFFIRAGWQNSVTRAVEENLPAVAELLKEHRFYVLDPSQVLDFLKHHYSAVALLPLLMVIDREALRVHSPSGFGYRLCLGMIKHPDTAISLLKWGVQVALMSRTDLMTKTVRESGHRESFEGLIHLLGEGTSHFIDFGF